MLNLITENLSTLKINKLTKEQYNRELAAGRIDENALYLTPDEDGDVVFDIFPTEKQIQDLPDECLFTVRAYGISDEQNQMATYHRTTSWRPNALLYKDSDGITTIYVVPVDQAVGEIYLPYYGIKTGEENAAENSAIMDTLIDNVEYGTTFRFPVGHFYFSKSIDVSAKHISIIGAVNASFKNADLFGTTFLHFSNLTTDTAALKVAQCTISDFTIIGDPNQYSLTIDRDEVLNHNIDIAVQEIANVRACGILASGCMNIRNIGLQYFYRGCWCNTGNTSINNITFHNCHYGLSIDCDTKVYNIFGWEVMVLLQMRGALNSAIGVRGDSVGKHLVEILGGNSHTLVDLDADFCMGAMVCIGDGLTSSNIKDLSITGMHGRCGVSNWYDETDNEITAQNLTTNTVGDCGLIAVKNVSSLKGAIITTNQSYGADNNPFDGTSGYCVPFVLLSAGTGTIVQGVQFKSTYYQGGELTEEWIKNRIISFSSLANACSVTVETNNGSIKYINNAGTIQVTDDATDIYQRMDKSSLAKDGEVVKTVNGVSPDEDGNVTVEIIETEPKFVESIEECVDTTQTYVLPDGYIYVYKRNFYPAGNYPNFTNQLPTAINPLTKTGVLNGVGYKNDVRYALDWDNACIIETESEDANVYSTGLIRVQKGDVVRINSMGYATTSGLDMITLAPENTSGCVGIRPDQLSKIGDGGGVYSNSGTDGDAQLHDVEIYVNDGTFGWVVDNSTTNYYMWFLIKNTTPPEEVVITVNEEITYVTTEERYVWEWTNTGKSYLENANNKIYVGTTPPENPIEGMIWITPLS